MRQPLVLQKISGFAGEIQRKICDCPVFSIAAF